MSYSINAWLDNGAPQLELIDTRTRRVCLTWRYQGGDPKVSSDRAEITRLFRDLILLTCQQQPTNQRVFEIREPPKIAHPNRSRHHSDSMPFRKIARRLFKPRNEGSALLQLKTPGQPA